jgi:hypothetical protein
LQAVSDALDGLLYHRGSDGIHELSVSESRPTRLALLGVIIWVEEQTLGPLEAVFLLDGAGSVTWFTIRAGDARLPRRDAPAYGPRSWRKQLWFIESRPAADADWEHVLDHRVRPVL